MSKMAYSQEVYDTLKKYDDNPELLEDKEGLATFKEFLRRNLQIHTVFPDDPWDDEKYFFTWQADGYSVNITGKMHGYPSLENLKEDDPEEFKRIRKLILGDHKKGEVCVNNNGRCPNITFDLNSNKVTRQYWLGCKDERGETVSGSGKYWDDYTDYPENLHRLIDEADADDIEVSKDEYWKGHQ